MKKITKKFRMEKAREIIDRNEIGVLFPDDDVEEFGDVCQMPIEAAVRAINPQFPRTDPRHLRTMIDGVWEARSWRKWIDKVTPEQEAKRAMRFAVRNDLKDFRDCISPDYCQRCGACEDLTVDHEWPPFDHIANEFLEAYGLPVIVGSPDPAVVVNIMEDPDLEAQWIAFHASRATYQILCRSCNASKGKR